MNDEVKDPEATDDSAAPEGVQRAREVVNEGLAAARERFREVASDAKGRYGHLQGEVRKGADRAGEAARERYAQVSENVRGGYEKARKDFDDLGQNVNEYVRDNPGRSVVLAAGVGFVIGLLMRGRRGDA